jgi:hypothetical protein
MRKDSGDMKPSVRSINMKSADFLQISLRGNFFRTIEPTRTPTKNDELYKYT